MTRYSPYNYAFDNPIMFIDPDGREAALSAAQQAFVNYRNSMAPEQIEPGSQADWNKQKQAVQIRHASMVASNLLANGAFSDQVQSLGKTLNNMSVLESSDQMYSLLKIKGNKGDIRYDKNTDVIQMSFINTSNFIHEMKHGYQFEIGEMAFNIETGKTFGMDIDDEVEAYKAQAAFDPSSVGASMNNIDKNFVNNLKDSSGNKIYGVGEELSNTSPIKITINSTLSQLIIAYPQLKESLKNLNQNLKLKDFQGLKFKQ